MSKLIIWQDFYSVEVAQIDEQHKHLIEMLNELYDAYMNQKQNSVICSIIDKMIDYTQFHFKTEEYYFKLFNYNNTVAHCAEHARFTKQVLEFKEEYNKNNAILTPKVVAFLRDWINKHIMESDQMYTDCFTAHGLH